MFIARNQGARALIRTMDVRDVRLRKLREILFARFGGVMAEMARSIERRWILPVCAVGLFVVWPVVSCTMR